MGLRLLSLSEAKFVIEMGCLYIHLYGGPYLKAWKDFNWKEKRPGLGINRDALLYAKDHGLRVRVLVSFKADRCYEAEAQKWINFSERTRSIDKRDGVAIYLLPWTRKHFQTIYGDFSHILKVLK